ncbi:MAG: 4-hydroxythreonine-4-phosphate dehydrogenase PdxA, partial [Mucilaginibacter sp.]
MICYFSGFQITGWLNGNLLKFILAFHYLEKAIVLANNGLIDGICTAPLNKEALHMGGHNYPGHTEILAEFTGTKDYAMMISSPKL